jgi:hypothetical protein
MDLRLTSTLVAVRGQSACSRGDLRLSVSVAE